MIGKIAKKGRGFRGLAAYLLQDGRSHVVAGPMAARTARGLAKEFGALRKLNPKLTKAVGHMMLSLSDGEHLSDEQWADIARLYVDRMGFSNAPWTAVLHKDTDHEHMHLMLCRIDFNGKTVPDANDYKRSELAVREIERAYGLKKAPGTRTEPMPKKGREEDMGGNDDLGLDENQQLGRSCELAEAAPADRREIRRAVREKSYEERARLLLGEDLTRVFVHPRGAVLYFKQPGQIRDEGDRLSIVGPMDEGLAVARVVALALDRAWPSISFTGSGSFVEKGMREALRHGMKVVPKDDRQQRILSRLLMERQGGAAAAAGPAAMPTGAVPAGQDLDFASILHELNDLPDAIPLVRVKNKQRGEPKKDESTGPVGTMPHFLNLRERLAAKRKNDATKKQQELGPTDSRPSRPAP